VGRSRTSSLQLSALSIKRSERFPLTVHLRMPQRRKIRVGIAGFGVCAFGARPVNSTDKSRWSLLFSYSPSDKRYWNGTVGNWGNDRKHLSDEQNPMLYFPGNQKE